MKRKFAQKGMVYRQSYEIEATGNPVVLKNVCPSCVPDVSLSFTPKQEGTGDPSPENVRPIVGMDSVQVTRCGKNLLNPEIVTAVSGAYGLTVTYENENIFHIVGKPNNPDNGVLSFAVAETLDYSLAGKGLAVTAFNLSGNLTEVSAYGLRTSTEKAIAIIAYLDNTVTYDARIQLAIGVENLATYEPYTGTTATLTLPETIYGGTVDAVTGEGERTVDVISLAVADMNNSEKFPGWKNQNWVGEYVENINQDQLFSNESDYLISNADGAKKTAIQSHCCIFYFIRLGAYAIRNEKSVSGFDIPICLQAAFTQPLPGHRRPIHPGVGWCKYALYEWG